MIKVYSNKRVMTSPLRCDSCKRPCVVRLQARLPQALGAVGLDLCEKCTTSVIEKLTAARDGAA